MLIPQAPPEFQVNITTMCMVFPEGGSKSSSLAQPEEDLISNLKSQMFIPSIALLCVLSVRVVKNDAFTETVDSPKSQVSSFFSACREPVERCLQ